MALLTVLEVASFLTITVTVGVRETGGIKGTFRADSNYSSDGRDGNSSRFRGGPRGSLSSTKARRGRLLLREALIYLTYILV